MRRAAIGVSAHLGWAATAVIAVRGDAVRVLRTDRLETAVPGDREAAEPHHVAGGFDGLSRVPRPADPERVLRHGLRRQERTTARALTKLAKELARGNHAIASAGILVSRGRAAPTLEKAIGSHTQIHIEEGLAVRASFRSALAAAGAKIRDIDQKSLLALASEELGRGERDLMAGLAPLRPENDGPWRKEERLAALTAWLSWGRRRA